MFMHSEEFVRECIESDIIDEANSDWLYVDDLGNSQVLHASVASAKSYLQFINTFHGIVSRLGDDASVALIYREEFADLAVYGINGMNR